MDTGNSQLMPCTYFRKPGQLNACTYFKGVTIKSTSPVLFLDLLKEYLQNRALKKQLSKETVRKYSFVYDKICRYFSLNGLEELKIDQVRVPILEDFRTWMHEPGTATSCGLSHSSRHLEVCIGAMNYAVRLEYLKYNPILTLETGRDKRKPIVYLEPAELHKFIHYNFNNPGFLKAQILYVFGCSTGISYGNLHDYKTRIDGETGCLWIEDNRKKIGATPFYIPLDAPGFEVAKAIHLKYEGHLPQLENGTYNRYLKEMTAILGINKRLTTHTARKTFATLMDQQGYSLGVISSILGNSEDICKTHYISPSKRKIEREVMNKTPVPYRNV